MRLLAGFQKGGLTDRADHIARADAVADADGRQLGQIGIMRGVAVGVRDHHGHSECLVLIDGGDGSRT